MGRLQPEAALFKLEPAGRLAGRVAHRPKDEMLLAAAGNDGQFGKGRGQKDSLHPGFVALGEGQPLPIDNEMAVVAHPLGVFFANDGGQFRAGLIEPEETILTDNITRLEFVVVGEGGFDPFVEGEAWPLLPTESTDHHQSNLKKTIAIYPSRVFHCRPQSRRWKHSSRLGLTQPT